MSVLQSAPLALIVVLCCLRWLGIVLFGSGFFLTRSALTTRNSCSGNSTGEPIDAQSYRPSLFASSEEICIYPKQFDRVVILVVDALRYDFVRAPPSADSSDDDVTQHRFYRGHLPVLSSVLAEQPHHSMLFRFEADAPTVTMQRLKALMTGSLPTFVDVADNYGADAVPEDNLVRQLVAHNRSAVFVGDDTWHGLYGSLFTRSTPHPSFNVKDLHSNDKVVMDVVERELKRDDWHLLIGHLLGVDHVGHRYGPNHIEMQHKLNSYNEFFAQTIAALDDNTLLLIFGDHGMTEGGDHGGASDDERMAAMFVYSRRRLRFDIVYGMTDDDADDSASWHVQQIDLVPTLALLLDVPIPFGNLGQIIPEFFVHAHKVSRIEVGETSWQTLNGAYSTNAGQLWHYLTRYQELSGGTFPESRLTELGDLYATATSLFYAARSPEEQQHVAALYKQFLDEALAMCRRLWSTFDLPQMTIGSLLCVGGVVVAVMLAFFVTLQAATEVPLLAPEAVGESMLLTYWGLDGALGLALGVVLMLLFTTTVNWRVLVGVIGLLMVVGTIARLLITTAWARVPWRSALMPGAWLVLLLCALRGAGQFSNSFIEADVDVLAFFVTTLVLALVANGVRWQVNAAALVAAGLCLAIVRVMRVGATRFYKHDVTALDVGAVRALVLALLPIALLAPLGALLFVRSQSVALSFAHPLAASSRALQQMWTSGGLAARIVLVQPALLLVHAMLLLTNTAPQLWWPLRVAMPQLLYASSGLALLALARDGGDERASPTERLVRALATLLLLLANVYILLLGPLTAYVVVLALVVAPLLLRIVLDARGVDDYASAALSFCLFGNLLFFATGHAYSFAELHVAAAFVGFEEVRWTSAFVLVLVNTFGSHIAPLLALPLVLTRVARRADLVYEQMQGALLAVHAFYAIQSCLTMLFVYRERRHLMVWRVFAPKFVFDAAAAIVVDIAALLVMWMLKRILLSSSSNEKTGQGLRATKAKSRE
jgi:phosphatidylinositol glycan class O